MLAHPDRDRRQLGNLVALRRRRVDLLLESEASRARLAALGPVVDDHVHPLGRQQPSVAAFVSGLAAAASARSRLLRARRRRGRILRGRQRRVTRAAVEALLELNHPGLEPPVRLDQLAHAQQQSDRRPPLAIENRLRLGTLHTRKEAGRSAPGQERPGPPAGIGQQIQPRAVVAILREATDADLTSGHFDKRPPRFVLPKRQRGQDNSCLGDHATQIAFKDAGRGFYLWIAAGRAAPTDRVERLLSLLNKLAFS